MLKNIILSVFSVIIIMSCKNSNQWPEEKDIDLELPTAFKAIGFQPVVFLTGYNAETEEFIVVDTLDGKTAAPCGEIKFTSEVDEYESPEQSKGNKQPLNTKSNEKECSSEVLNPSPELRKVLELSKSGIKGSIVKNGEKKEGLFHVSLNFIYNGSFCETTYGGGSQYESCIELKALCLQYQPYLNDLSQSDQNLWNSTCPQLLS